ncbi:hypothetical protein JCM9533A_73610 [Catenuloplanes niger JCM 9533]
MTTTGPTTTGSLGDDQEKTGTTEETYVHVSKKTIVVAAVAVLLLVGAAVLYAGRLGWLLGGVDG